MDYVTLSLLLGGVTLIFLYMVNIYSYWKKRGVPQASGIVPFVGHLFSVVTLRYSIGDFWTKRYNKYRDYSMVGFYNMLTPILMVREPGLVKQVMQTNFSSFHRNGVQIDPEVDVLLSKNPFFNEGEVWMTARKKLTHAFSSMRLKLLFDSVNQVCEQFHEYVQRKAKNTGKYEVELKDLFSRFTGQVVSYAGYSIEGLCFEDGEHPESLLTFGRSLFKESTFAAVTILAMSLLPGLRKIIDTRFVAPRVENHFKTITKQILEVRKRENIPRKDVFQMILDAQMADGGEIDEVALTAHTFSFFLDGYETSSTTLSFVGYQLAVHQDVQDKLRNEVMSILKKNNNVLTYDSLKEMTYMDQVISETQRHNPVVGILTKKCTEDVELVGSDGLKCPVQQGTQLIIPIQGLQNDPKYWTNPEVFDPERFADDKKTDIDRFTFLPFGEGPRICVGMRMAILQMKTCLATLLSKYKLELSPKTKLPFKLSPYTLLSTPIGGFWVNIKPL